MPNQMTTALEIVAVLAIYGTLYILIPLAVLYTAVRVIRLAMR